jgi:hypothetical protein
LYVVLAVVAFGATFLLGGLTCPRKVVVVVEKPVEHIVEVNNTTPFEVMRDSVAKLLARLRKPTPEHHPEPRPVPETPFFMPQRQVLYGFSFVNGEYTASIFDSLEPHYRQETMTGLAENLLVEYDDASVTWSVRSWSNIKAGDFDKPEKWSFWRFTGSATLGWSPGNEVWTEARPGVLILGHLALGPYARLSLADLRGSHWQKLQLGAYATLVW